MIPDDSVNLFDVWMLHDLLVEEEQTVSSSINPIGPLEYLARYGDLESNRVALSSAFKAWY